MLNFFTEQVGLNLHLLGSIRIGDRVSLYTRHYPNHQQRTARVAHRKAHRKFYSVTTPIADNAQQPSQLTLFVEISSNEGSH